MTALTRAWNDFWFRPERPTQLALCRIVFFGYQLYFKWGTDTTRWSAFVPELWFPMPLFRMLGLGLPPPDVLHLLDAVWKLSLGLACLGLATRAATGVAFGLGLYLLGVPHNFGKIHHSDAQLIFILAAMALARCGEHMSLDAWLAQRRGAARPPEQSGEYRWPVRAAWLAWILVYFSAGIAKLRNTGFGWVDAESMSNRILLHQVTHQPSTDWGVWVANQPALCFGAALLALSLELASPIALFSARARAVFVPMLGMMQVGIGVLMGVSFGGFVAAYVFWLPWGAIWERAAAVWDRRRARAA